MIAICSTYHGEGPAEGPELETHPCNATTCAEAWEVIDRYPFRHEQECFEKYGEMGGISFLLGNTKECHVCYQFIPTDDNEHLLDMEIVLKTGVMGIGRKAVDRTFHKVSIAELKDKVQDLFLCSVEDLYNRYQ